MDITNPTALKGEENAAIEAVNPSKKALKKAAAKDKKEQEKNRRALERDSVNHNIEKLAIVEDTASGTYGKASHDIAPSTNAQWIKLDHLDDAHVGQTVCLNAWIRNSRPQGAKMAFLELRQERDWAIQALIVANAEGTVSKQMVKWAQAVNLESYAFVEALVQRPVQPVKSCRVGDYELLISRIFILAAAPNMLPMPIVSAREAVTNVNDEAEPADAEGDHSTAEGHGGNNTGDATQQSRAPGASIATHLDNIVMHKRAPIQQCIADVRQAAKRLFRSYLEEKGFNEFEAPCLLAAASEGGANVFDLPYFGKQAFLAQSPQFYKQIEIAGGRGKVYCIGPIFRAENSNTPRHMTEFTGMDMEMMIRQDYREVLQILEDVLLHIFRGLEQRCSYEIELIRRIYPSEPFKLPEPGKEVRLTFAEGQALLRAEGPPEFANVSDLEDMSTPQEKALGALILKKYNTDFYVLDKFPEQARPFYTKLDPTNPKVTNGFDFFMRGQEILSGGQRINDPEELEARIREKGIDPQGPGMKEYLHIFKQAGCPPHGGGGIGLDRVVAFYLGLPTILLAAYYPRTPKRLTP